MANEKRETLHTHSLQWYRFDRYTVLNGFIRPAEGAILHRYDASGLSDGCSSRVSTAYHELLVIGRMACLTEDRSDKFRHEDLQDAVLRWCGKFGLLGLLDHHLVSLRLAPRWSRLPDSNGKGRLQYELENINGTASVRPTARHASNSGFGWQKGVDRYTGKLARSRRPSREGGLVPPAMTCGDPRMIPHAVLWTGKSCEVRTICEALGPYFPSMVPESLGKTRVLPHEDEWCRGYAETLLEFTKHAKAMFVQLQGLVDPEGRWGRKVRNLWDFLLADRPHFDTIDLFMGRRYSNMLRTSSGLINRTEHPSLLAFLSELAWEDMRERPHIRICSNVTCQSPFSSKSRRAQYCSARCQNTDRKRVRRSEALCQDDSAAIA